MSDDERPREPQSDTPARPEFDPSIFADPGVSEEAAMTFSEANGSTAKEIEHQWQQLTPAQQDEVRRRLQREGLIDTLEGPA